MKRILTLLLAVILMLSLAACGGETATTDTGSADASASDTASGSTASSGAPATDTDSQSTSSTEPEEEKPLLYDDSIDHLFMVTDITNHSIVVYDLDACEGDFNKLTDDKTAIVWEWDAEKDPNCKINPGAGIDSAKFRYSAYYKKDVVIACSSGGWAGVIDYEKKTVLWEYNVGNGPHSIEMIPNGDVVVACSSDPGALAYVPLSAGATKPSSSIPSLYCHGVSWDPENEWLWVLEDDGVYAAGIKNMGTKEGQIYRIGGTGSKFGNGITGGHAFSPIYGQPGMYWASSASHLWQFDSVNETITRTYDRSSTLTAKSNIKGIASFVDGTVVETVAGLCGNDTYGWSSDGLRIITREMTSGKVQVVVTVVKFEPSHREFYKVQPFTKEYQ